MKSAWYRRWCVLALLAMLPALVFAQHGAQLPATDNLQQSAAEARSAGVPLLLMFSLPDCPYCKVVRRNYLLPMMRSAPATAGALPRELTMNGQQAIRDFDGSFTTPSVIAKRYRVQVAPTLVLVDGGGEMLAEPLVGGDHAFYDAVLERMLDESRKKLAERPDRTR